MPCKPLSCQYGRVTIYQRHVMVIMMHLALLNAYHLRVVLNMAMNVMIEHDKPGNTTKIDKAEEVCPGELKEVEGLEGDKFKWRHDIKDLILYSFYIGYLLSHIPGGWLADVIGARHVVSLCMALSTLITLVYPFSIKKIGEWGAVSLRLLLGIVQGPMYPAISALMQCWVPASERALSGGIAYGGSNLGTITGNLLTGIIIYKLSSWEWPFYIWGFISLIWWIFYLFMVFSKPSTHPFVTEEERTFLEAEIKVAKKIKVPWGAIFKSRSLYALLAGQFAHDYLMFSLVTDLPKYLHDMLKYKIQENGAATAIPFVLIWISSILSGYLADWIVKKQHLRVITTRRIWTVVASVGSSVPMIIAVYIGCQPNLIVSLYALGLFIHGPFYSGMKVNINDISIFFGGSIMAVVNGFGALGGIFGPLIIGQLTRQKTKTGWQLVFWINLGVQLVTTVIYCIFSTDQREPWDKVEEQEAK